MFVGTKPWVRSVGTGGVRECGVILANLGTETPRGRFVGAKEIPQIFWGFRERVELYGAFLTTTLKLL
jgi:hypothetical protein